MPRPSKLTEQVRSDLVRLLSTGVDVETAAAAAGIDPRTYYRWKARGEELRERQDAGKRIRPEDRVYLTLLDEVTRAKAEFKTRALAVIQREGQTHWQAMAWLLERMFPDEFAGGARRPPGRPRGSTSSPDRPSTATPAPPRVRLKAVK